MHQLSSWFAHYNEVHPHKALGYRSPREFIAARGNPQYYQPMQQRWW
jgi:putative transposase